MITYSSDRKITIDQFIQVLIDSTLAERRPIEDIARMTKILQNATILITCWDGDKLVGISRAISDFAYCTYVSDLAVAVEYQHQGIGKRLLEETRFKAGGKGSFFLFAAPKAHNYYPHIGFELSNRCFVLPEDKKLV